MEICLLMINLHEQYEYTFKYERKRKKGKVKAIRNEQIQKEQHQYCSSQNR
jgi:hypothetical protein